MTQAEIERITNLLKAKETELSRSIHQRDEIVVEKASDSLDEIQLMGERELAIRNLDRDSQMLRQVLQAMARLKDGSYGICRHCGEEILPKRISAVPWAAFCIRCQESMDRGEIESQPAGTYSRPPRDLTPPTPWLLPQCAA
jgi:DnaK suppressor protein